MREILTQVLGPGIVLFVIVAMFNLGLDLTTRQIVEPLRNRRMLTPALAANIVLIPLMAVALTMMIPLPDAARMGILLYAFCTGSEAGPKLVQIAKGNAAFGVALLGILIPVTVLGVPLALSSVLPGVHVEQGKLLVKLLAIVALPLALGLVIKANYDAVAARLSAVAHRISLLMLLGLLVLIIYVHFDKFAALQSGTVFASLLFFALAFAIGYLMGGPGREGRKTLAIMSFIRAGSVSMVIAGQAFAHEPGVLVMATVMTGLSVIVGVPTVFWLRRYLST